MKVHNLGNDFVQTYKFEHTAKEVNPSAEDKIETRAEDTADTTGERVEEEAVPGEAEATHTETRKGKKKRK